MTRARRLRAPRARVMREGTCGRGRLASSSRVTSTARGARRRLARSNDDDDGWERRASRGRSTTRAVSPTELRELLTDGALGVGCYFISDEIAQRLGRSTHATETTIDVAGDGAAPACELPTRDAPGTTFTRDGKRSLRFATFGAMDGATSYVWYETVDRLIPDDPMRSDAVTTAMKVGVDAVAYNPVWGAFFIVVMGALSGKTWGGIKDDLERDWMELYVSNLTFWVPMNFIIYGFTPLEYRVGVLYALNILYVCSLSMFQARKTLLKDSGETMNVVDVVARALPDEARADWRTLTGCPSCAGERFVPCPQCQGADARLPIVIDIKGGKTRTIDACEVCADAKRIMCPECAAPRGGPLASEDELTPTY